MCQSIFVAVVDESCRSAGHHSREAHEAIFTEGLFEANLELHAHAREETNTATGNKHKPDDDQDDAPF
jgi:hypothetical protein